MFVPLQQVSKIPRQIGELIPAVIFLSVWISPRSMRFIGENAGNTLDHCMWLEFIMGHAATAFIVVAYVTSSKTSRVSITAIFGVIYAGFVVVMCFAMGSFYPLIQFGFVLWGRLSLAKTGSKSDIKITHILLTASRVFLLMITAGIAAAIPLPRLGATPEAIQISGGGIMAENPHMIMAWGFIYFVASWYLYNIFFPNAVPRLTDKLRRRFRLPC
jgi:hypothetical protein